MCTYVGASNISAISSRNSTPTATQMLSDDYIGLPKLVMALLTTQVLGKAGKFTELKLTWVPTRYSEQGIVKDRQWKWKPPSAIKRDQKRRADFLKKKYDSNQQSYRIIEASEIPKHKNCVSSQCKVSDIVEEYVVDHGVQTRSMTKSDMDKPRQDPSSSLPVSNITPEKLDQSDFDFVEHTSLAIYECSPGNNINVRLHVN